MERHSEDARASSSGVLGISLEFESMGLQTARAQTSDWLKSVTPLSVRRQLMWTLFRPRMATNEWRTLPDALVIGAQRCGTSSLYKYLGRHPDVAPSYRKEIGYFSVDYHRGEGWYRAHFPLRIQRQLRNDRLFSFEATPDYLVDPRAPERAAKLVPDAKIVVLLRNPVDRALSHYEHNRRLGNESLPLSEAIDRETDRLAGAMREMIRHPEAPLPVAYRRYSYVTRGMYASQIQRWMEHYPRERILVVRSEDFYGQTSEVYQQILSFLGLRAWQPWEFRNYSYIGREKTNGSPKKDRLAEVRASLTERMAPANQMLSDLMGREFGW